MGRMRPKDFAVVLERDGYRCAHCGCGGDTLIPNHRANRGHGGSKVAERLSNVVTMCARANTDIESDAGAAAEARRYGWKLSRWEDPAVVPVYDLGLDAWYVLDDNGGRTETTNPHH